jgi:2-oxoisovalerate dehydrogenase E1 component alpha subunit
MADRPDPQAQAGHNAPGLSLHVPEPKFRPGDAVDFSHVDVGEPGKQPRPDETCAPEKMRDFAYGLVRVLGDDNRAHGPGIPSSIPKRCARCSATWP